MISNTVFVIRYMQASPWRNASISDLNISCLLDLAVSLALIEQMVKIYLAIILPRIPCYSAIREPQHRIRHFKDIIGGIRLGSFYELFATLGGFSGRKPHQIYLWKRMKQYKSHALVGAISHSWIRALHALVLVRTLATL